MLNKLSTAVDDAGMPNAASASFEREDSLFLLDTKSLMDWLSFLNSTNSTNSTNSSTTCVCIVQ